MYIYIYIYMYNCTAGKPARASSGAVNKPAALQHEWRILLVYVYIYIYIYIYV